MVYDPATHPRSDHRRLAGCNNESAAADIDYHRNPVVAGHVPGRDRSHLDCYSHFSTCYRSDWDGSGAVRCGAHTRQYDWTVNAAGRHELVRSMFNHKGRSDDLVQGSATICGWYLHCAVTVRVLVSVINVDSHTFIRLRKESNENHRSS